MPQTAAGLLVRSVIATVLIPGTVAVMIPYLIVRPVALPELSLWLGNHYGGAASAALGLCILLWCIRQFALSGKGTLAPFDEPRSLVIQGPYRYVRNPMYVAVLMILLGESWFISSTRLLGYTLLWFIIINVVVLVYEEPNLRSKHGPEYERYCKAVRRWLPGRAYKPA